MAHAFPMELYDPAQEGAVDMPSLRDAMQQLTGIAPASQLLVYNHRLLQGNGTVRVQPAVSEGAASTMLVFERPPADKEISVRIRFEGEPDLSRAFSAGTPVAELKRLVARRYQLAPHRQELTTLGVVMAEGQPLAAYAAHDPVDVGVKVVDNGAPSHFDLVLVSVRRRNCPAIVSFTMYSQDTFDMLLGKMERAGMIDEGEELTLVSSTGNNMIYEKYRRTFGDYQLTHAQLRILE